MLKKILIGILVVTVIALIGGVVWFFFFTGGPATADDTPKESGSLFGRLFPFNEGGGDTDPRGETNNGDVQNNGNTTDPQDLPEVRLLLEQLTSEPVTAAAALVNSRDETVVRFVERASGNLFEINLEDGNNARLSNSTIPGVHEGVWHESGTSLIIRYLSGNDVIKSFSGTVASSTTPVSGGTETPLDGLFLNDDISFLTVSPDQTRIFYLLTTNGGVSGYTSAFNGSAREKVFDSPFNGWIPQWVNVDTLGMTTRAASAFPGFHYLVDKSSGEFVKTVGDVNGLTANVSPDERFVLYSESAGNTVNLFVLDREENETTKLTVSGLPEKCVWSMKRFATVYCGIPTILHAAAYPEAWYQGLISFSDDIWEVDVARNISRRLVSPLDFSRQEIDVTEPLLSQNEEILFFINKKDSTLWSLQL